MKPHSSAFGDISALYSHFLHQLIMQSSLFEPGYLRPCPSYSRRRDRIHLVLCRSLYKGGGGSLDWHWLECPNTWSGKHPGIGVAGPAKHSSGGQRVWASCSLGQGCLLLQVNPALKTMAAKAPNATGRVGPPNLHFSTLPGMRGRRWVIRIAELRFRIGAGVRIRTVIRCCIWCSSGKVASSCLHNGGMRCCCRSFPKECRSNFERSRHDHRAALGTIAGRVACCCLVH